MRLSPLVSILIACLLGVVTLFLIRYTNRSDIPAQPADKVATETPVQMRPVVVAQRTFQPGDLISEAHLTVAMRAPAEIPHDGFEAVSGLLSSDGLYRKTLVRIEKGQPIQESRLSPVPERLSLSGQLKAGERAYTLRMDDVRGVAGLVLPGDRVDILHTYDPQPGVEMNTARTEVLFEDIKVLALDLNADPSTDTPRLFKTVTLAVSLAQASQLSTVSQTGRVSLALRSLQENQPDKTALKTVAQQVKSAPDLTRPRPARQKLPTERAAVLKVTDIQVVHGDRLETVSVPLQ